MCSPITCQTCGKATWTGCGQHVDQVMARIPESRRCAGHGARAASQPDDWGGWLDRLLTGR